MENAILLSMGIGIGGAALLTAWCLYSRHEEIKAKKRK